MEKDQYGRRVFKVSNDQVNTEKKDEKKPDKGPRAPLKPEDERDKNLLAL